MLYTTLGRSNLRVSRVAFGTWQLGGAWGPTDETAAVTAIRRAVDQGITLFDTAQAYGFGASERLLARALERRSREGLVIATKGGVRPVDGGVTRDSSPAWIREGVVASLRALDTEVIDLYQIHWPDPATALEETAATLAALVAEGKINHVGVSNFDVNEMKKFNAVLPVETLQPPYSLFQREIEAGILPYTEVNEIGVLVYGPLAHGLLSGRLSHSTTFAADDWRDASPVFHGATFRRNLETVAALEAFAQQEYGTSVSRLAVAWTLARPGIDVAIVGIRDPRHVDDVVRAVDLQLDGEALARIDEITSGAVTVRGPSPEGV
jgi:aryl-alcohol dehydrogenase-like predicted oxidoreductase